ncbi:hypothetical protein C8N35_11642 [Breoghania corrubedonensis]|uniref:Uncharacterized protein n=1 Tax=Breoghania corrubedonensis TaxID=665038 RepID=A0A2T5UPZ8_9HYPH|nr:hypothetical protein C8N35_11642 [Breoghania corrubedonensis]
MTGAIIITFPIPEGQPDLAAPDASPAPAADASPTAAPAMIVRLARNVADLIARSIGLARVRRSPLVTAGLHEDRSRYATGAKGRATVGTRQHCRELTVAYDLDALLDYFRQKYPALLCQNVAADTGIPAGTVENWMLKKAQPSTSNFVRLVHVYGPSLLAAALIDTPMWLARAVREERIAAIDSQIQRLREEQESLASGRCPSEA